MHSTYLLQLHMDFLVPAGIPYLFASASACPTNENCANSLTGRPYRTHLEACPRSLAGRAEQLFCYCLGPGLAAVSKAQHSTQTKCGSRPLSFSYFCKMFLPNENFVPTTTRTLLRPPFNKFEKKL